MEEKLVCEKCGSGKLYFKARVWRHGYGNRAVIIMDVPKYEESKLVHCQDCGAAEEYDAYQFTTWDELYYED